MNTLCRLLTVLGIVVTAAVLGSCGGDEEAGPETKREGGALEVRVVNYPLQYFARHIGGEHVHVVFPAPGDGDPAFWEPDAEGIGAFQDADVILLNGAGYAKWVAHATLPPSALVVTAAAAKDRFITIEGAVTHGHGPAGEHSHAGTAFTTWLDPTLAIVQAEAVKEAFATRRPALRAAFQASFDALKQDLLALDGELEGVIAAHTKRPLIGSHPVYQYFTRRYSLNLESVHWEPDAAPSPAQWKELDALRAKHPATLMLWEGSPLPETVAKLKERGLASVVVDPCGNVPETGDYLAVMRRNTKNLAEALGH